MKERFSNIELLRLVCMFLIIMQHFLGHAVFENSETFGSINEIQQLCLRSLHALTICAVNTFILISGYFSIRPKAKSFFNLYTLCAFYCLCLYLIHLYITDTSLNRNVIYYSLFPFTKNPDWWFIPQYVILYTISPILNFVIDKSSKRELQVYLILLSIVVFYFGFYRNMSFANNGFNFINFVFLYFIGRYIALYMKTETSSWLCFFIYFFIAVLIGVLNFASEKYIPYNTLWSGISYNHPLCVFEAMALFKFFEQLKLKNYKAINLFAVSALPIYLVHNNMWTRDLLSDFITQQFDNIGMKSIYIMLSIALLFCILIPLLDKIRIVVTKPFISGMCYCWSLFKIKFSQLLLYL